ncbi:hypothetical protein GCM10010840_13310 [Deinococcus aerolatus]|uniref:Uncharacterized protein n=1 Tax=Deinococcus aerolatus TaxID=522487 RepID=A0ABQ2G5I0_9DEIO|nr:hypothetical protein [Deinococcus aerolatus]GGL76534.1 hypothetical protein GCM10010840_13310 [Deinococcus aerolatus]
MTDRLALPAAAALAVLTLALWVYLLLFQTAGVQVANRSGAVLGGLTVCPASGKCLHRAHLWPHQTWQIPLDRPAGEPLRLTVREVGGQRQMLLHTPRTAERRASFVVGQGGRIVVQ